ncbi:MAG: UDP-N-acetylglucosamine 2-epimerase (hydrolyzing), partial [Muribaculaceae bacterium]|nr:UDP-N-acetylglucosamine 2-epimerase (hydrolyzing) [Muribaculaceae bacterium]
MGDKRKICIVTGTRAEYGILSRLMKSLDEDSSVELQIIATNMHLSPEFGMTVKEIEEDGLKVDRKVEMLLSSDTAVGTVKSMGLASIGLADAYAGLNPDLIVILGDRYEMLSAASAALIFGIPVAHLHGGEITEGAYDDAIRHAITKLSYLHFTATEEYRNNIIQMGESPDRVFWVGALGADNIGNREIMSLKELEESLGFNLGEDFLLVTFHPVTREPGQAEAQTQALLDALENVIDVHNILFTLPNSDTDGRIIARMIHDWVQLHPDKAVAVTSLGRRRYYSALKYCKAVVGNSSSGLCEAPSFRKPTLNIGIRQQGRTQGNTIVNCDPTRESISDGLRKVLSDDFAMYISNYGVNPYVKPNTLSEIKNVLKEFPLSRHPVKHFYKIPIN